MDKFDWKQFKRKIKTCACCEHFFLNLKSAGHGKCTLSTNETGLRREGLSALDYCSKWKKIDKVERRIRNKGW